MDVRMYICIYGRMDEWKDGWMDGWRDASMYASLGVFLWREQ